MRTLIAAAAAALLAGCAGAPVGWGGTHEVLFSTPEVIKVQWDRTLFYDEQAVELATKHCGSRSIELIDASSSASSMGLVRSKTWRCVSSPAAAAPPSR